MNADPRQTPEIRGRRARAIAARRRTAAEWNAANGDGLLDPEIWPTIQAGLATVKLAQIMAATGISKSFASTVRSGASRPHVSLWRALAELAGVAVSTH